MIDKREVVIEIAVESGTVAERVRGGTICPTCFELRGRMRVRGVRSGIYQQRCTCDAQPKQPREVVWAGFDYNTLLELCYCCGATPIPSGSRWSPFFCDGCKERVGALNSRLGFALIPIGRHSMMNHVSVDDNATSGELALFVTTMHGMFARMDDLRDWRRQIVRENLERSGFPAHEIALVDYVERARTIDRQPVFVRLRDRFFTLNAASEESR